MDAIAMPDEAYHVFDRIAIRDVFDDVGSKYVPPHVNIFYCFGGLVFTSFIAQVTTGAAMTFYYVPEVSRSLSSVAYITYEARNGWALRSMHRRWSAPWWSFSRAGNPESLLRGSCSRTALAHSYLDAFPLLVHPQAGHIRATVMQAGAQYTVHRIRGVLTIGLAR